LWVFWLAPLVGAALAGLSYRFVVGERMEPPIEPLAATAPPAPA
jgi:hypothetical protein